MDSIDSSMLQASQKLTRLLLRGVSQRLDSAIVAIRSVAIIDQITVIIHSSILDMLLAFEKEDIIPV